jgi:O-antigen ligase
VDNGYLSITVDVGLLGLLAVLVPIALAVRMLLVVLIARRGPPPAALALALAVVGMAVVTAFYDSFYWAQINLLLFAFGGVLSTIRVRLVERPDRVGRGQTLVRRRLPPELSGGATS